MVGVVALRRVLLLAMGRCWSSRWHLRREGPRVAPRGGESQTLPLRTNHGQQGGSRMGRHTKHMMMTSKAYICTSKEDIR